MYLRKGVPEKQNIFSRYALFMYTPKRLEKPMDQGLIAIIITVCIIIGAIKTRRTVECMLLGSLVAAFFAFQGNFLAQWCVVLQEMLAEEVWVFWCACCSAR